MRRKDIDYENLTVEDFHTIMEEHLETGAVYYNFGKCPYDDTPMLIVDSWEELTKIDVILNGWEGGDVARLWNNDNLNEEINKKNLELEKALAEKEYFQKLVADEEVFINKLEEKIDRLESEEGYPTDDKRVVILKEGLKNRKEYVRTELSWKANSWHPNRLEGELKKLYNLSAFKRWLYNNNFEEVSLDNFGIEAVFSDEYSTCPGCGEILRTSPDSYHWTAPLWVDCEGYVCEDCVASGDYDEYILEDYKNEQKSIPDSFDLSRLGLVKINDDSYENGFHAGMDDSPEPIIEKLNEQDVDVWFKVYPSQFYIEFDVYVKEEDEEKAKAILSGVDTYQGYSTSGNLERALKDATRKMNELPDGEGIKYSKCDIGSGTASVRLVSKEEFVKGIK